MGEDDMSEIIGNPSLLPEVSDQVEFRMELHGSRATPAADAVSSLDTGPDPPAQGCDGKRRLDDHAEESDPHANRRRRRKRARTTDGPLRRDAGGQPRPHRDNGADPQIERDLVQPGH
jgi:hypothetical protein